jgi:purine-nucleoside phosphorylase
MVTPSQAIAQAASFVQTRIGASPRIGIVLGSGLMHLASLLDDAKTFSYEAIPHFPIARVTGHQGTLHVGRIDALQIACLAGRVHGYEGQTPERVAFGVRVLARLGCSIVILSNAAGAVSPELRPGSLMLISDHLNLTGNNPLIGWHYDSSQFVDMTDAYDHQLRAKAKACAKVVGVDLREGVYAGLLGPSYETPAEIRALARLGADAVGMSTVYETIALRELGVRVLGLSCITNVGAGIEGSILDHAHVQEVAHAARHNLESLVLCLIRQLAQDMS